MDSPSIQEETLQCGAGCNLYKSTTLLPPPQKERTGMFSVLAVFIHTHVPAYIGLSSILYACIIFEGTKLVTQLVAANLDIVLRGNFCLSIVDHTLYFLQVGCCVIHCTKKVNSNF